MNIAIACPRFLWAGGGSILYTQRCAEEWVKRGHAVTVLTDVPPPGQQASRRPQVHGYAVRELVRDEARENRYARIVALQHKRGGYRLAQRLLRSGKRLLGAQGPWCAALAEAVTWKEFDVAVVVNSGSTAFGLLAADGLRTFPGRTAALPLFHPREEFAGAPVHDRVHASFDKVLTLTDFERDWLIGRGHEPARCITVGAGSDPQPLPPTGAFRAAHGIPQDAPVVLFLGRKIYNKGAQHVIEAMDALWARHPEAWLVLLGFAHNQPDWVANLLAARSAGQAQRQVVNLDDVPTEVREQALADCTVLAAPSISDSFGIVYLDAWRHRKPIIAADETCCASYMRHGEDALLVPFGDVPQLGNTLQQVLREPEHAALLGEAGFRRWEDAFTWERVVDRIDAEVLS